jgi:para-aminobenzoate synthetase component 1
VRTERLGPGNRVEQVLRALQRRAHERRLPPPAALSGSWFGAQALLAPAVALEPAAHHAFDGPMPSDDRSQPDGAVGGGWIGYLAYPDTPAAGERGPLPAAVRGWTDCLLRLDADGCWWFDALAGQRCPPDLADAVHAPPEPPQPWTVEWTAPDKQSHQRGVAACLEAIRAGEVYQACVCAQFVGTMHGDPLQFFADAAAATRPARAAFLQGSWGAVASLSPELFLQRRDGIVRSSPIKGTLPLSADPELLRRSVKDVAENIMIVDLVRNDLGRVAEPGSVIVTDLLGVYPAPGVWHLVSTVQAGLRPAVTTDRLLDAAFPPASVTGTPKHRARQLLAQWEPRPRGVYCGAIGLHSPHAGLELNVAIRTVEFAPDGTTRLGVGGGITIDSDPEHEWQECLHKAASIVGLTASAQPAPTDVI